MASSGYTAWVKAGRPLNPAQPVRDIVTRMKLAYPRAAGTFSWYANDAHYQATPAEDHTPFSQTGWPLPSPRWWVFATDIMHRPDLGVDCGVLFPYWLAEAKAGRMPWLKYLIWQAKLYDVRNNWKPQGNTGHYDHVHFSVRTDHRDTSLGAWSLTPVAALAPPPPEDDMPYCYWNRNVLYAKWGSGPSEALIPATADAVKAEFKRRGISWADIQLSDEAHAALQGTSKPVTVTFDTDAVAGSLAANQTFLTALAKAVNDDNARRMAS